MFPLPPPPFVALPDSWIGLQLVPSTWAMLVYIFELCSQLTQFIYQVNKAICYLMINQSHAGDWCVTNEFWTHWNNRLQWVLWLARDSVHVSQAVRVVLIKTNKQTKNKTKKKANAVKMKNDPTGHLKRNRPSPESTLSPHGVNTAVHRTFSVPCAARQLWHHSQKCRKNFVGGDDGIISNGLPLFNASKSLNSNYGTENGGDWMIPPSKIQINWMKSKEQTASFDDVIRFKLSQCWYLEYVLVDIEILPLDLAIDAETMTLLTSSSTSRE